MRDSLKKKKREVVVGRGNTSGNVQADGCGVMGSVNLLCLCTL